MIFMHSPNLLFTICTKVNSHSLDLKRNIKKQEENIPNYLVIINQPIVTKFLPPTHESN